MPINFELLNAQGSLPDFLPKAPQGGQGGGGGLSEYEAAKLNMAYAQDQRAAAMDDAKLAREKQATQLDLNTDDRAERKTLADISNTTNLTNAQVGRLAAQTGIDWKKFTVDSDIAYKDYGLRVQNQEFEQGLKTKRFGLEEAESKQRMDINERTDARENRKFDFEITKWQYKNDQENAFKDRLAKAAGQSREAYQQALLAEGRPDLAEHVVNMDQKYAEMSSKMQSPDQLRAKNAAAIDVIPDFLAGKPIDLKKGYNLVKGIYGEEAAKNLTIENAQDAFKSAVFTAFGPEIKQMGDASKAAQVVGASHFGLPVDLTPTDSQREKRSEFLTNDYTDMKQNQTLNNNLKFMSEVSKTIPLVAGTFNLDVRSAGIDSLALFQGLARKAGIDVGEGAMTVDQANEILESLSTVNAGILSSKIAAGMDQQNARMATLYMAGQNVGPEALDALRTGLALEDKIQRATITGALADDDQNATQDVLLRRSEDFMSMVKKVEQGLGRVVTQDELQKMINDRRKKRGVK